MAFFNIIKPQYVLSPYIRHYWYSNVDDRQMTIDKIIPMGCIYMLFHLGNNRLCDYRKKELRPDVFVCGQSMEYSDVGPSGYTELFTVVFQPYAASIFFNMPANLFKDQRIDVNDIGDLQLIELTNKVKEAFDIQECINLVEKFMINRLTLYHDFNLKRIVTTVNDMVIHPEHNLNNLADIACYSPKQYSRLFMNIVGTTPKNLTRIIRLQKALYMLRYSKLNMTQIAYNCGYTDPSHMNHEFRFFTDCTPLQYVSSYSLEKEPYSQYYDASMH